MQIFIVNAWTVLIQLFSSGGKKILKKDNIVFIVPENPEEKEN